MQAEHAALCVADQAGSNRQMHCRSKHAVLRTVPDGRSCKAPWNPVPQHYPKPETHIYITSTCTGGATHREVALLARGAHATRLAAVPQAVGITNHECLVGLALAALRPLLTRVLIVLCTQRAKAANVTMHAVAAASWCVSACVPHPHNQKQCRCSDRLPDAPNQKPCKARKPEPCRRYGKQICKQTLWHPLCSRVGPLQSSWFALI